MIEEVQERRAYQDHANYGNIMTISDVTTSARVLDQCKQTILMAAIHAFQLFLLEFRRKQASSATAVVAKSGPRHHKQSVLAALVIRTFSIRFRMALWTQHHQPKQQQQQQQQQQHQQPAQHPWYCTGLRFQVPPVFVRLLTLRGFVKENNSFCWIGRNAVRSTDRRIRPRLSVQPAVGQRSRRAPPGARDEVLAR